MTRAGKYCREVAREAKRIRWPKREDLFPTIAVVICIAAFAAIFIVLEDLVANELITLLKEAFGG